MQGAETLGVVVVYAGGSGTGEYRLGRPIRRGRLARGEVDKLGLGYKNDDGRGG